MATSKHLHACWAAIGLLGQPSAIAGDFALVGATIHTAAGDPIPDGVLIVRDGKIATVGPRATTPIPQGMEVVGAEGRHVAPGLIDLGSGLFLAEGELRDSGSVESRSVLDAYDPFDEAWPFARAAGITSVAIAPGTSQRAGGLGAVVKLGAGGPRIVARESHFVFSLGVSQDRSSSAERLEQYYRARGLFLSAKEYGKSWDAHWKAIDRHNEEAKKREEAAKAEKKPDAAPPEGAAAKPAEAPKPPPKAPAADPGREALLRAMEGKLPVFIEAHRRDDIEYALLLRKELGLKLSILGATQGRFLADTIAKSDAGVAVQPVLLDRWALEYRSHSEENAAALAAASVPVAIASSGASGLASRRLRWEALAAVRGGLPREKALRAVTLEPARMLGLEARLGSIEPGKDADFVVFSGDPLDAQSRVELVSVDGELTRGPGPDRSVPPRAASEVGSSEPAGAPRAVERSRSVVGPSGRPVLLANARILQPRASGSKTIEKGAILVRDGRIEAVGEAQEIQAPDGAEVIDLAGKWLLPGFIDAHSHAGLGGETDDIALAVNEDLRVLDAFDPWDPELPRLLARGITSVALSPGSVNVVGGWISLVKIVPRKPAIRILQAFAGRKASLAPALSLPRYPTSLGGAVRQLESWARELKAGVAGPGAPVLVDVPNRATAERAVAALAAAQVPIALRGVDRLPAEAWELFHPPCTVVLGPCSLGDPAWRLRSAAALRGEGVPIAFATDGTRRDLLTSAVLCMEQGLSSEDALSALTVWPAALYRAGGQIGCIEKGGDADLVVWSGDPFALTARVEMVFVDGVRMDLEDRDPDAESAPQARSPDGAAVDGRRAFVSEGGVHAE